MRVVGDAGTEYSLLVTRGASFSLSPNHQSQAAQDITTTGNVLGALAASGAAAVDHFLVAVNPGDELIITTTTPGDGAGEPVNTLDPRLELFDATGQLVASNDNDPSGDGRNARVGFTVPAGAGGLYRVAIARQSGAGDYTLSIDGATGTPAAPRVVATTPADGALLGAAPAFIDLVLSAPVRLDSLDAGDLTIDGGASVTGVGAVDARTVRFTLDVPAVETTYSYNLAAGSVLSLQGVGNEDFAGSFVLDLSGPRVTAQSPLGGQDVAPPLSAVVLTFDETLDPQSVSAADVASFTGPGGVDLTGAIVGAQVSGAGNEVTVTFTEQSAAGGYTLTFGPDVRDGRGNLMDQDADGQLGEATDDQYTASFSIAASADLVVEDAAVELPTARFINLARLGVATQSSTAAGASADRAIDGNTNGSFFLGSVSATQDLADSFWQVELAADSLLQQVVLFNRTDPGADRLSNFRVNVLDDGGQPVFSEDYFTPGQGGGAVAPGGRFGIDLPDGVVGRTVRVELLGENNAGDGVLSLAEVQVFGTESLGAEPARVTWTTANRGDAAATGGWAERVIVTHSTSGAVVADHTFDVAGDLAPGQTRGGEFTFAPTRAGDYTVQVVTDADDRFFEVNDQGHAEAEQNNAAAVMLTIEGGDLLVTAFAAPTEPVVGNPAVAGVTWTVTNQGPATDAGAVWVDRVFYSANNVAGDADDISVGQSFHFGQLLTGETYDRSLDVTLPADLEGAGFLYVKTDALNAAIEGDSPQSAAEQNNASAPEPIDVVLPFADLLVEVVLTEGEPRSGQPLTVSWRVRNAGNAATIEGEWFDSVFLSEDDVLDGGDLSLGTFRRTGNVAADTTYSVQTAVTLPEGVSGSMHVLVRTDSGDDVFESGLEANNVGRTSQPIDVALSPPPDLLVASVNTVAAAQPGQSVTATWTVINQGTGEAGSPWTDRVYLATDGTVNGATLLATVSREASLSAGEQYASSATFEVPVVADGDYRIVVVTDSDGQVFELDAEDNNTRASNTLSIGHPDLEPVFDVVPANATSGETISVTLRIRNAGSAAVLENWTDRLYLSSDALLDAGDTLLGDLPRLAPLSAGGERSLTLDLALPIQRAGDLFLLFAADADDAVNELADESDNLLARPIQIAQGPFANLVASDVTLTDADTGAPITEPIIGDPARLRVGWTVSNTGTGVGPTTVWVDRVIASRDDTLGNGDDVVLGTFNRTEGVEQGEQYSRTETLRMPPAFDGRVRVFVVTDADGVVFENGNESDNIAQSAGTVDVVTRPFADLVVDAVVADPTIESGQDLTITWTVSNQGIGPTNTQSWTDRVRLIALDPGDQDRVIGNFTQVGPLSNEPGRNSYTRTVRFPVPVDLEGAFVVRVTTGFGVFEFIHDGNNTRESDPVQITLSDAPDLVVTDIVAPPDAVAETAIDVSWTVQNTGNDDASGATWVDQVFLQRVGDPADRVSLGRFVYREPLGAGLRYTRQEQVTLPRVQGLFQIVVETNRDRTLFEAGATGNNVTADDGTVQVTIPDKPDLRVGSITAPDRTVAGGSISLEFEVVNEGLVPTDVPNWKDRVYLSLDNRITGDDILVATLDNAAALGPQGDSYRSTVNNISIPLYFRGPVFLIVQTDATNRVDEFPDANPNTLAVQIEVDVTELPPSDLIAQNVVAPAQVFDGANVSVSYEVTNLGAGRTVPESWTDTVWLTLDQDRPSPAAPGGVGFPATPGDFLLGTFNRAGGLEVGQTYSRTVGVRLPSAADIEEIFGEFTGGAFFITVWTDAFNVVPEDTFDENINPADPTALDSNNYRSRPITVLRRPAGPTPDPEEPQPSDLTVTQVAATPAAQGGDPFTVSWTVQNVAGNATTSGGWVDRVYLTDAPTFGASSVRRLLGAFDRNGGLGPGAEYSRDATFTLAPDSEGMHVVVLADANNNEEDEIDEGNNQGSTPTVVTPIPADLVITAVATEPVNFSGEPTTVSWTVTNSGLNTVWEGTEYWFDDLYFSPDPTFIRDRASKLGSFAISNSEPLEPGESYTYTADVVLPRGIDGEFFVYVEVNTNGPTGEPGRPNTGPGSSTAIFRQAALETDLSNNMGSAPLDVTYFEPDLIVSDLVTPATPPNSGEQVTLSWTVTNQGNRATRESFWLDRIYLSLDETLDFTDTFLGQAGRSGSLGAGESYTRSRDVTLPENIQGDYHVIVYTDSNIIGAPGGTGLAFETAGFPPKIVPPRVPEFLFSDNNVTAAPMPVNLSPLPDLRVTLVDAPTQVTAGQFFDVTWRVENTGAGPTPPTQSSWDDLLYLSRDAVLDLNADRFMVSRRHTTGLAAGGSYEVTVTVRAPGNLVGPYFVIAATDPVRSLNRPRAEVFEGANERNNSLATGVPLIIETPPPTDLVVQDVVILANSVMSGERFDIQWTGRNADDETPAVGRWTDTAYLSTDAVWSIDDIRLGALPFQGTLAPGETYDRSLTATMPPVSPDVQYRVIVRPDIFNEINEGGFGAPGETNNQTPSSNTVEVTVDELFIGLEKQFELQAGASRLLKLNPSLGETIRISVDGVDRSAHEIFIRRGGVPTVFDFDFFSGGRARADQQVLISFTEPTTYFILIRGNNEPGGAAPVKVLAESLPLAIDDVVTDVGGDSRYVTTTIHGSKFREGALVKLVRPGIGEFQPVRHEVVDSTEIVAVFDLTDAPHGLYDVEVINPDGEEAVVPYRYRIERFIEPDVNVGLGGPSVINPGNTGTFGFSLVSRTNIDTPYTFFQFGVPELGTNPDFFDLPYIVFDSNLRGEPPQGRDDVSWASIESEVNADPHAGLNLAPGFVVDLPTRRFIGRTFTAQIYPGFTQALSDDFEQLRDLIYAAFPDLERDGVLDDGPEGLDEVFRGIL